MKKLFLLLLACSLLFCSSHTAAKCYTYNDLYVGSSIYHSTNYTYTYNLDTSFSTDDQINLAIHYYYSRQGEYCYEGIVSQTWYKNGAPVSDSAMYTVTDTGMYQGEFLILQNNNGFPINFTKYVYLHIGYYDVTAVSGINSGAIMFAVLPSVQNGVFKVQSSTPLKTIVIGDAAGRIVLMATENLSSLDISRLPSGIYFYYAEDKSLRIFRGRIAKV
jgi:hypothetical protein